MFGGAPSAASRPRTYTERPHIRPKTCVYSLRVQFPSRRFRILALTTSNIFSAWRAVFDGVLSRVPQALQTQLGHARIVVSGAVPASRTGTNGAQLPFSKRQLPCNFRQIT